MDWLRAAAPRSGLKTAVAVLFGLGLALFGVLTVLVPLRPEKGHEYFFMSLAALAAVCLAAILGPLARGAIRPRTGLGLLLLLMLFELHNVATFGHKLRTRGWQLPPKLQEHTDVARYLINSEACCRGR